MKGIKMGYSTVKDDMNYEQYSYDQNNGSQQLRTEDLQHALPSLLEKSKEEHQTKLKDQSKKPKTSLDEQKINLITLLSHIYHAGWLTPYVIALLMRPNIETKLKFAQRLLRQALAKGYVSKHPLRSGKSFAYCVTDRGASFLRGNNVQAERPYRLRLENGFQVPNDWEHHLFSVTVLALLKSKYIGSTIYYERQLRIMYPDAAKIPDGFLRLDNGSGYWLEVERAHKGRDEREKIHNLIFAANNQTWSLLDDIVQYDVVIALNPKQIDHRFDKVNHKQNLMKFFKEITKDVVEFYFAELNVNDTNVVSFELEPCQIFSEKVLATAELLTMMDWRPSGEAQSIPDSVAILYKYWQAEYKYHEDGTVQWACDYGTSFKGGREKDFETAMKFIASVFVRNGFTFEPRTYDYSDDDFVRV